MKYLGFLLITALMITAACKKDEPEVPNEEELITTLIYTLTPTNGGGEVEFVFRDLDGEGGNQPVLTEGVLMANTQYEGSISLLNETESPAEDITEEVMEESDDHQFFYSTNLNNLSIDYDDSDSNGNPVGIFTNITTGAAESGVLTIVLRHEPNKEADGVSDGIITNAGGESDIEVIFNVQVQ